MRELNSEEVELVDGGWRGFAVGLITSAVYDGVKAMGGAIANHYAQSTTAVNDDPASRGRALL